MTDIGQALYFYSSFVVAGLLVGITYSALFHWVRWGA